MNKTFWGPSTWYTIHSAAISYKPENRVSFKQFIYSLPYLLPCDQCREHLDKNLQVIPLDNKSLEDNINLFIWSYFLHDLVNKQLNKPRSPPYPALEKQYIVNVANNKFWGPHFWRVIHSFAAAYRPTYEVKQAFKQFIYSLTGILPCDVCRQHYLENLKQLPLTEEYLSNSHNLFLWSYLLHDLVNKKLGKYSPPFEQVKSIYFNDEICETCGI